MIFGQPYHLHVRPDCSESWECPDDVENACQVTNVCKEACQ
jgi:hypothetical protein